MRVRVRGGVRVRLLFAVRVRVGARVRVWVRVRVRVGGGKQLALARLSVASFLVAPVTA